ncbi:YebC/PmpR family DNA-binding transcriptional regulator [Patescibacteria group bacterium]|nr:YebC/PmpR family DNA-binding transcriptional regulator [Patescibacteria group bacterium]
MSGHSKWHRIKHQKAATDSKRSKLFGRLSQDIKAAAQDSPNPDKNARLREAIERARAANLPQANSDRLLSTSSAATKTVTYEGYGPGGAALLINAATDNQNRTVSEIRSLLKKHGGTLSEPGSVQWKFSQRVIIETEPQRNTPGSAKPDDIDVTELAAIDAGATEITRDGNRLIIIVPPQAQDRVTKALAQTGSQLIRSELSMTSPVDQQITLTAASASQLTDLLAELVKHPDITAVFTDTDQKIVAPDLTN